MASSINKIIGFTFERLSENSQQHVASSHYPTGISDRGLPKHVIVSGLCFNPETSSAGYGHLHAYFEQGQISGPGLCGGFLEISKHDSSGPREKIDCWAKHEGASVTQEVAFFYSNDRQKFVRVIACFDDNTPAPVLSFWKQPDGEADQRIAGADGHVKFHAWGSNINSYPKQTTFKVGLAVAEREEVMNVKFYTSTRTCADIDEETLETFITTNKTDRLIEKEIEFKTGVPFLVEGKIKFSAEIELKIGGDTTREITQERTVKETTTIKPGAITKATISTSRGTLSLPYVATVRKFYQNLDGYREAPSSGILNSVSHYKINITWEDITSPPPGLLAALSPTGCRSGTAAM